MNKPLSGTVSAIKVGCTLVNILGQVRGGRLDAATIAFPTGIPFLLVFYDDPRQTINVATRQFRDIYPADPKRLASHLGVGAVPIPVDKSWEVPWHLRLTVKGVEIARIITGKRVGWGGATENIVRRVEPILPIGKIFRKD